MNGPKLGRRHTDEKEYKKQLRKEWLESGERGAIEREFGVGKRRYTLDCVMARLQHTSEVTICTTVLVMNLRKKLRLLLRKILVWRLWRWICQPEHDIFCFAA